MRALRFAAALVVLCGVACEGSTPAVDLGPGHDARRDGRDDRIPLAVGMIPFVVDPDDPAATGASRDDVLDRIAQRGAAASFIQQAKWSAACAGDLAADYAGVAVELAGVLSRELDLLYALDFTRSGDRSQLNRPPGCPLAADQFHFTSAAVADAFVAEVEHVATRFAPRYLAIGVEIDGFLAPASAAERQAFRGAFQRAHAAAKAARPDSVVFAYFQFENTAVLGDLWPVVAEIAALSDAHGFSSYPQALQSEGRFASSAALLPGFYDAIVERLGSARPVIFAELGATVTTSAIYDPGPDPRADQALFVNNFFAAVRAMDVRLVNWMFFHDLDFYGLAGATEGNLFFSGMGLAPGRDGPAAQIDQRGAHEAFFARGQRR